MMDIVPWNWPEGHPKTALTVATRYFDTATFFARVLTSVTKANPISKKSTDVRIFEAIVASISETPFHLLVGCQIGPMQVSYLYVFF